jgi:hypothetical protein
VFLEPRLFIVGLSAFWPADSLGCGKVWRVESARALAPGVFWACRLDLFQARIHWNAVFSSPIIRKNPVLAHFAIPPRNVISERRRQMNGGLSLKSNPLRGGSPEISSLDGANRRENKVCTVPWSLVPEVALA